MRPRLRVPEEGRGLPVIASVSGGKDSTALILALREADIEARHVFADTGWEAPETYEYLDMLRARLGIAIDVVGFPGGLPAKVRAYGHFPSPRNRWCTRELKLEPLRAYHDRWNDGETICALGIRAAESAARARQPEWDDEPPGPRSWGGWVWRPLLEWSIDDVLAIHHRHGLPVHPLYLRGHERVGCYPCIFANKADIALLAREAPERIAEIRELERDASATRSRRLGADVTATFFQTRRRGFEGIDAVATWARTTRGGRQLPLLPEPPRGGCVRWGLCEPPSGGGHD